MRTEKNSLLRVRKMENKVLKDYLNMFKDDATLHVIVANPQDRKVYTPQELNMIYDKGQEDLVLCIGVGRAEDMDKEMVETCMNDERATQPELPRLKNNDQRKDFLKTYRDWPVWFEVPQADEVYYRYILPDDSAIVICEYKQYVEWKEKYMDDNPESTYTKSYLLNPGYHHLHDCETNDSTLVKKLMEVQKK